jgi:hypothetical protein
VAFEVAKNEEIQPPCNHPSPGFPMLKKSDFVSISAFSQNILFFGKKSCCFRNTQKSKQSLKCVHFFVFSSSFGIKNLS